MLYSTWLETEYHREIHSSLGITPLDAWLSKCNTIKRIDPTMDIGSVSEYVNIVVTSSLK